MHALLVTFSHPRARCPTTAAATDAAARFRDMGLLVVAGCGEAAAVGAPAGAPALVVNPDLATPPQLHGFLVARFLLAGFVSRDLVLGPTFTLCFIRAFPHELGRGRVANKLRPCG